MAEGLTLDGFRYFVCTRTLRMALMERGVEAASVEVDPFAAPPDATLTEVTALEGFAALHGWWAQIRDAVPFKKTDPLASTLALRGVHR